MKKFFFVFSILLLIATGVTGTWNGKDKCDVLLSPLGGYSMLRDNYIISYFDDNGFLDTEKVKSIAKYIGKHANGCREFPFWINSKDSWEKLHPWQLMPVKNSNDFYIIMRTAYLQNWSEISRIYNGKGVKLWFSLFEHNGLRNNSWNPWVVSFGKDGFYSERAKTARHIYIDAMLKVFRDGKRVVGFELCNEPRVKNKGSIKMVSEFLADTFCHLIKSGVQPGNIDIGIQYDMKEHDPLYSLLYRQTRKLIVKKLKNVMWAHWLKSRCISPCHGMTWERLEEMLGPRPPKGGSRNLRISTDGWRNPRPTKEQVKKVARYLFEKKPKAARRKKLSFEVVFGKEKGDPLDSIMGVIEAYHEFFGYHLKNYKQ